jgi:hypothetical protein
MDNIPKSIIGALKGLAFDNDSQVTDLIGLPPASAHTSFSGADSTEQTPTHWSGLPREPPHYGCWAA